MKDENILLTICLIVIFITIVGLSLQSCRSSRVDKQTTLEIDTTRQEEKINRILADSIMMESLKTKFKYGWTQEFYIPVMDSTGAVVGSVLNQRNTVSASRKDETEKVVAVRQEVENEEKTSASGKMQLADVTHKESKPVHSVPWQIYVMVVFMIVSLCLWQKFRPK